MGIIERILLKFGYQKIDKFPINYPLPKVTNTVGNYKGLPGYKAGDKPIALLVNQGDLNPVDDKINLDQYKNGKV